MQIKKLVCFLVFFVISLQASAQSEFVDARLGEHSGEVNIIHYEDRTIVIDDVVYLMPLNFKVYDKHSRTVNRYAIKIREMVDFYVDSGPVENQLYIKWLKIKK